MSVNAKGSPAPATAPEPEKGEFARNWTVLLAALLGTMCGASPLPYNTIGSFLKPLTEEFGWNVGDIQVGILMYGLTGCIMAPIVGGLADRYGTRRVGLLALAGFGLAFAATGLTSSLFMFYTMYFLIGLLGIGSTPVTWSRAINLSFVRHRGLALGIMLVGTGIAAFILPSLTVFLIERFGWRLAYGFIALLPLLIAFPAVYAFIREPAAGSAGHAAAAARTGLPLNQVLRDRRFWIMILSFLLVSLAYGGFHTNLQNMIRLKGFSDGTGALVAGCVGLSIIVGRIGTGFLVDRFWAPMVALPLLTLPAFACMIFMSEAAPLALIILAAIMLGCAAGAETDLIAYLSGRYFGMAYYGRIYGMLYAAFAAGSSFSPPLYGYVYATSGSYSPVLIAAAVMFVAGGVLLLALGRYPASFPEAAAKA
ncbi:MFS transporter [Niveispirillum fermenti]|uniref:MFS transporter n=1 Tax=Niveispirillum fermenti TaxID=1233113 RepID=UPI003A8661E1